MSEQLIVPDAVLRVAGAVLPPGRVAEQISAARDTWGAGRLAAHEVREVLDAMIRAQTDAWCVVAPDALAGAIELWRTAMARLVPMPAAVSVHVWDVTRDGPEPCIAESRLPTLPDGARWC